MPVQRPQVEGPAGTGQGPHGPVMAALLPLLPAAWRRPGGLPPEAELWQFLVGWAQRARGQLDELEGYLLAAAQEEALASLGPAAALADLGRVRVWLEELERAPDLDAFLTGVRLRPGLLPAYERLERWREFWRSPDRSRLLLAYRSLASDGLALPEGEAFLELKELRATLLAMFHDPSTVLDAAGRQRFWDGLDAFWFRYREIYRREHDRRRSPAALAPYRQLRDGPAFRLLLRLRHLEGAPVRAGLRELEARLQKVLASQCPGVDEDVLRTRPVCTCNFRLDEPAPEPVEALARDITREAWHGIRILQDPEVRRRLHAFRADLLRQGQPGRARRLEQLLQVVDRSRGWVEGPAGTAGESHPIVELERLLDDGMLAVLNEGLHHPAQVWLRPVEPLLEQLVGRDWSWEQLQQVVADWALGAAERSPGMLVRPVWGLDGGSPWKGDGAGQRARPGRGRRAGGPGPEDLPGTFGGWETAYGRLVREGAVGSGALREGFRRFYRQAAKGDPGAGADGAIPLNLFEPAWESGLLEGVRRPATLPVLLQRAREWNQGGNPPLRLAWADGLRYDVWHRFVRRFEGQVQVVESGLLWVFPPATTAGQMARVDARGIRFSLGEGGDAGVWPESILYLRGQEEVLSSGAWSLEGLVDAFAEELLPRLQKAPEAEWLVFSDHGFLEGGAVPTDPGAGRGEGKVARQGGDTMEEVLVPWARVRWRG